MLRSQSLETGKVLFWCLYFVLGFLGVFFLGFFGFLFVCFFKERKKKILVLVMRLCGIQIQESGDVSVIPDFPPSHRSLFSNTCLD